MQTLVTNLQLRIHSLEEELQSRLVDSEEVHQANRLFIQERKELISRL